MTFAVLVRNPTFWTSTNHGPDRNGINHTAVRRLVARRKLVARIHALLRYTSQLTGTIQIQLAFLLPYHNGLRHAVTQRITLRQIRWTDATGCVILGVANCVLGARWIGNGGARVDAVLLQTSPVVRAIAVGVAFDAFATIVSVSGESGRTTAA